MLDQGHFTADSQKSRALVETLPRRHLPSDAQPRIAAGLLPVPPASPAAISDEPSLAALEDHFSTAPSQTIEATEPSCVSSAVVSVEWMRLLILADAVDDLERTRIANQNRLRSLAQVKGLADGRETMKLAAIVTELAELEHGSTLELQRAMRQHPLGPFVKRTVGLGEKQTARLLAAIGDPADRPNPAKLWAYCGFHVIGGKRPRRAKGQKANWNTKAKSRAYLCAEACMKQRRSPYRDVYDRERAKWADRDTTDLHKHNHALSVTAKAILLDLWREARAVAA